VALKAADAMTDKLAGPNIGHTVSDTVRLAPSLGLTGPPEHLSLLIARSAARADQSQAIGFADNLPAKKIVHTLLPIG
jgi:hypothetical protein